MSWRTVGPSPSVVYLVGKTNARRTGWRPSRHIAAPLAWPALFVIASLLLAACGAGGTAPEDDAAKNHANTRNATTASAPSKEAGVFFPKRPSSKDGMFPAGLAGGKLVVENGCLVLKDPDGSTSHLPVWPPDYSLSRKNGEIRILDGDGKVVARVGDEIRMDGGEIRLSEAGSTREQAERNYEEKRREFGVPARCPGPLWVVGRGVSTVQRG